MRRTFLTLSCLLGLAACQAAPERLPGDTDARCIHRLYDYPVRAEPFQAAASTCAPGRVVDLTGDRYYQELASSLNVAYVSHDPPGKDVITLTGSRIAQPTSEPAPPELRLR